jgi:hypothetical protein
LERSQKLIMLDEFVRSDNNLSAMIKEVSEQ